jgi:hypothetical protein
LRSRQRQRGSALLLVAVLGFLTMALWITAARATHDGIRTERFVLMREQRAVSVMPALTRGVALLRTGTPTRDRYSAVVTVIDGDSAAHDCVLDFARDAKTDTWSVEARPANAADLETLPVLPATFER